MYRVHGILILGGRYRPTTTVVGTPIQGVRNRGTGVHTVLVDNQILFFGFFIMPHEVKNFYSK